MSFVALSFKFESEIFSSCLVVVGLRKAGCFYAKMNLLFCPEELNTARILWVIKHMNTAILISLTLIHLIIDLFPYSLEVTKRY